MGRRKVKRPSWKYVGKDDCAGHACECCRLKWAHVWGSGCRGVKIKNWSMDLCPKCIGESPLECWADRRKGYGEPYVPHSVVPPSRGPDNTSRV